MKRGLKIAHPTGKCYCGCDEDTDNPRMFFLAGHNKIAEARVIREIYGNLPNMMLAHGMGPKVRKGSKHDPDRPAG